MKRYTVVLLVCLASIQWIDAEPGRSGGGSRSGGRGSRYEGGGRSSYGGGSSRSSGSYGGGSSRSSGSYGGGSSRSSASYAGSTAGSPHSALDQAEVKSGASNWVLLVNSPGCGTDFITSRDECMEAAHEVIPDRRLSEGAGVWDEKPPGCSVGLEGEGEGDVIFNYNIVGTTGNASRMSICLNPGSAVIPEVFNLTGPNCTVEDNVEYRGHDYTNYPNNSRVFANGTVADCANWCGEVEDCKFWTFVKSRKVCFLKDDKFSSTGTDQRINTDRVSGSKECAAPIGILQVDNCVTSPGYPNNYDNNEVLEHSFSLASTSQPMEIIFHSFDVEAHKTCRYDRLEFYDGNGKLVKSLCGYSLPPKFTIPTSSANIRFITDYSGTERGFKFCFKEKTGEPVEVAEVGQELEEYHEEWHNDDFYEEQDIGSGAAMGVLESGSATAMDATTEDQGCSDGETYENNCYLLISTPATFHEAQQDCSSRDGNLASILNEGENNFVANLAGGGEVKAWIGATDEETEGVWRWTSGGSLNFTSWATSQPNSYGQQNCAATNHQDAGKWDDVDCTTRRPYICQGQTLIKRFNYTEVEEILYESHMEQLEKENVNLKRKIQMLETQLIKMQNLKTMNKEILQKNVDSMKKNEELIMEEKTQALEIEQLEEKLNSSQEEFRVEREMHNITQQQLQDLTNLVHVSMNFTKILVDHISQLESMKEPQDMKSTIMQMKEKEKLYMAENLAYQNEIQFIWNLTSEERDQNENLIDSMTQQGKLGKLKERMISILHHSLMEMARTIPDCTDITTQELEAQLDVVLEEEDTLKQLVSECTIFNATSTNLRNLYTQHNSQLKKQLATKLNVINHHIEENRELAKALEDTKLLARTQSESLQRLAAEMDSLIPNGITRVHRNDDGIIESVYLCQCMPEAPKFSELRLNSIEWSCPYDKVMYGRPSGYQHTVSIPCSGSHCWVEALEQFRCDDALKREWSPWRESPGADCIEITVKNRRGSALCGHGHRSRSRQVRLYPGHPWRREVDTEECQPCNQTFASNGEVIISPPQLEVWLKDAMVFDSPQVCTRKTNIVPQCSSSSYTVLNDVWRKIDYIFRKPWRVNCDSNLRMGWYRFEGGAGTQLPTSPAPNGTPKSSQQYCGTHSTAYMTGGEHPTPEEGIVTRGVRFEWSGDTNEYPSFNPHLKVAACYGEDDDIYYVYELTPPNSCSRAYCALDGTQDPVTSSLSLVGGSKRTEGNVHYLGKPICDDNWSNNDGRVACRQLGFSGLERITVKSHYGSVSPNMAMDEMGCSGSESRLQDCPHNSSDDCGEGEGAGVVCIP